MPAADCSYSQSDRNEQLAESILYFFHDPMCSWCWGYRPVSDRLLKELPDTVKLKKIVGGLAPDCDQTMPVDLQEKISAAWERISQMLGTEFNFDFWSECEPRRSTYPACRAVLAAGRQGKYDEMIDAIQRAYYLRAMNPSDLETLETLAAELNIDVERFCIDVRSPEIESDLQRERSFSRESPIDGFPSLALEIDGVMSAVTRDYTDHRPTIDHITSLISRP